MYYDEADIGFQLARAGLRAYVDTRVAVRHKNREKFYNPRAGYLHQRNRVYLIHRYGKWYHRIAFHAGVALFELPAKVIVRALQGRTNFARACVLGYIDGLAGRMGLRARDDVVSMLGRNTAWNLFGQVLPAVAAVFTVPILIRGLGTERFGVLTLIWLVVGYFSIFDLGLGRALTQLLAERLGQDDHRSIPALVWTALGLMGCLGVLGTAVALLAAPSAQQVLKAPTSLRVETLNAVRLLALSIPLVVGTAGFRGVLEARQRFDLANVVRLASGVFTYVGPV